MLAVTGSCVFLGLHFVLQMFPFRKVAFAPVAARRRPSKLTAAAVHHVRRPTLLLRSRT